MTALFGNLLENAVEAAEGTSDPFVELSVTNRDNYGLVLVAVANTCKELPVEEAGTWISQKREKNLHGIGLQSVRRTMKKYRAKSSFTAPRTPKSFMSYCLSRPGGIPKGRDRALNEKPYKKEPAAPPGGGWFLCLPLFLGSTTPLHAQNCRFFVVSFQTH